MFGVHWAYLQYPVINGKSDISYSDLMNYDTEYYLLGNVKMIHVDWWNSASTIFLKYH